MRPVADSRPQLRPGCRFSENPGSESVLLIPEGILNLAGPGRKILELCDGERTFKSIITALHSEFPSAAIERVESETASYLERLRDRQVIEY